MNILLACILAEYKAPIDCDKTKNSENMSKERSENTVGRGRMLTTEVVTALIMLARSRLYYLLTIM